MMRLLILLGLALYTLTASAQLTETYFNDQYGKARGLAKVSKQHGESFIIGGCSFDRYLDQPSITKTDLDGTVIWSTTTTDAQVYVGSSSFIDKLIVSDDFIYATCVVDFKPVEIWKVNAATGEIVWKKAFTVYGRAKHMIDYDATRFLLSYPASYNGSSYQMVIAFIDKATGNTLNTRSIGAVPWEQKQYGVAVDPLKDIYFTRADSIFKISGADPSVVLWKTENASANIMEYHKIHADGDQIFLFGSRNTTFKVGKVLSLNKDTGALLWETTATGSTDVEFSDMADDGTNLVVTWKHIYVGGGDFNMWTTKINKASGSILWQSTHSFESDKTEAALALALDGDGNVLLTGYHRADNYGPGEWAFAKLNGTTGASIYGQTITENASILNELSMGIALYYIDGSAYMVGNLETFHIGSKHSTPAVVKVNPVTQEVLFKKYLYGSHQFPSRTIAIERNGSSGSSSFQLRQAGQRIVAGLYNGHDPVWEKTLTQNYMLFGSNLVVSPDQTITVTGYSMSASQADPFYESYTTDSIHTFTLDTQGTLLSKKGFSVSYTDCYPLETIKDGNRIFVLYRKGNALCVRKIENGTVSAEVATGLSFVSATPSATKNLLSYSDTEILVAGYKNSFGATVSRVNKSSLAVTTVSFATSLLSRINFVEKIDGQTLLLAGKKSSGKDCLARYNVSTSTLLWSKDYTASSELYKFVFNQDSSAVYATGVRGNDLFVRKINTTSGDSLWTYNYNHATAVKDIPLDIAIDLQNNKLVVVGYNEVIATPNGVNDIFIHTINTAGKHNELIIRSGEFAGKSKAAAVKVFSDGQVFIGGNLNHAGLMSGFLYSMNIVGCDQLLDGTVSQVTDHITVSDEGATYQWLDCDTGLSIAGAVNKDFTPVHSGSYSVEVSKGGCNLNSECFAFIYCEGVLDAEVSQADDHLVVSDADAEYQWIDCSTGLDIPLAVDQTFTPQASGQYKVSVSKDGCSTTSECFAFIHCEDVLDAEVSQADDHLVVSDADAAYQWIDCSTGLDVTGATDQTFTPQASGQYKVSVSKNGCSTTSACLHIEIVVTGVPAYSESDLQLFPNPATHQVTIDLGKEISAATISIKDPNGVTVFASRINNQKDVTVSTRHFPSGIYSVLIEGPSYMQVKKLMVMY